MAHWVKELRTKEICSALAQELRRLKNEELLLRAKLIKAGVRDVSNDVALPPNRLDQLDEESADYDDKRLCHSCKHICFFSAAAFFTVLAAKYFSRIEGSLYSLANC